MATNDVLQESRGLGVREFRAGSKPWQPWSVQRRYIIPPAIRCGIGRIGWHSFRQYSGFLIIPGRLNLAHPSI
jgi:hypothetical protein